MRSVRILILDSDEVRQQGLRRVLETNARFAVCGETADPDQALAMVASLEPDVVVMEAAFSASAVTAIHRSRPSTGVLLLLSREGDGDVEAAVRAGARAVATESDSPETIRRGIEAAAAQHAFLSPCASEIALDRYLGHGHEDLRTRKLTAREREVVRLLADGKSSRDLARMLDVSVRTVENHRANAMRKLGARSAAELVRAAIRAGVLGS